MEIHKNERKSYDEIIKIGYGYSKVKLNGLYGIIDQEGFEIIEPKFDMIGDFYTLKIGIVVIKKDGKYGFLNSKCEIAIEPISDEFFFFVDGLSKIHINNKVGFVDTSGNIVIEPKYDSVQYFHDNLSLVEIDKKYGFINQSGQEVIEIKYDYFARLNGYRDFGDLLGSDPSYFQNNMVKISLDGKWGIINKDGNIILPIKYDYIGNITNNSFTHVKLNGKTGLINSDGKELIPPKFDHIGPFKNGYAQIKDGIKVGLINSKFKIILEPKYHAIYDFVNGFAMVCNYSHVKVQNNGCIERYPITYYGFINMNGKEIVAPNIYTKATNFENGFAEVFRSNFYGKILIDEKGKESLFPYKK